TIVKGSGCYHKMRWNVEFPTTGTEACWECPPPSGWPSPGSDDPGYTAAHSRVPTNHECLARDSAIGTRTGPLPAEYPSVMQGRGGAAQGLMRAVLSYEARLPGAAEDTAWR